MNTQEYTFQNLFGSSISFEGKEIVLSKIEIPIIQRDYAQGRESDEVGRIRSRFLDALSHSILNEQRLTLDFVYGDVSEKGVLTPLDGQQRLTTLFLLYWYTAKKENLSENEYDFLNKFTYSTRFSSRDFCLELVKYTPDFVEKKLSYIITDQSWYPYEWKNDPTIKSMLVMIDAIHEKFNNQQNLWSSLKNISFYFLPLTEMGLSDDLYIKMNSRGKPLTQFEHFKAEFEERIKEVSEDYTVEINHKFDIEWTDMLFPYRGDNNIIDDEFMRYFHFISDVIFYRNEVPPEKDEFKIIKLLYNARNSNAKANLEYFKNSFDCWHNLNITDFFKKYFSENTYESDKVSLFQDNLNIFKECCDNYGECYGRNRKFPLNKILLLFAIITYLQNKSQITDYEFRRRIRIIRNLIWNSTDEIREERMRTLLSETEIIILTGKIPFVEKGDLGYNVRQKDEERSKILWLDSHSSLENDLFNLEDHPLLKGCIAIVDLKNSINFNKFRELFDNCNKDLINKALLSVGDYSQFISWRYQIGAKSNESVWFDLFHPSKNRQGFEKSSEILNLLLSELDNSEVNNDHLEKLINIYLANSETKKDWRYYFVKYSSMRKGNFGMYYWRNLSDKPYEIIMMNTEKSMGGRNWDIAHYTLKTMPEFDEFLKLGDFAYQGDKLKIRNSEIVIECFNDRYEVSYNENQRQYEIQQVNGIDVEDRIEKGKKIISELLKDRIELFNTSL